jgi:hypothetical protein
MLYISYALIVLTFVGQLKRFYSDLPENVPLRRHLLNFSATILMLTLAKSLAWLNGKAAIACGLILCFYTGVIIDLIKATASREIVQKVETWSHAILGNGIICLITFSEGNGNFAMLAQAPDSKLNLLTIISLFFSSVAFGATCGTFIGLATSKEATISNVAEPKEQE